MNLSMAQVAILLSSRTGDPGRLWQDARVTIERRKSRLNLFSRFVKIRVDSWKIRDPHSNDL